MPRSPRNFAAGHLYLVSQEGNKLYPVYLDQQDKDFATVLLIRYALRHRVRVHDCLHETHRGRWLLEATNRHGISYLMRDMQSQYSRYLNRRYGHRPYDRRNGHCIRTSSNWVQHFEHREVQPEAIAPGLALLTGKRHCRQRPVFTGAAILAISPAATTEPAIRRRPARPRYQQPRRIAAIQPAQPPRSLHRQRAP